VPQPILVPREGASDDFVALIEISVPEGSAVQAEQVLCICETSKTTFEVVAPGPGHVHWLHDVGDRIAVGAPCALLADSPLSADELAQHRQLDAAHAQTPSTSSEGGTGASPGRISKSALELARQHGVDLAELAHLPLLRKQDVQDYIDRRVAAATGPTTSVAAAPTAGQVISTGGQRLVIYGGGGHAKMCIDILKRQMGWRIEGIVDSTLEPGSMVLGVPVLGGEELLQTLPAQGVRHAVLGVGAATQHPIRTTLFRKLKAHGFELPNIIHPTAVIEPSAQLGEGNQVMAQAYIGSDARIGSNCIINALSVVSHDSQLADNVHLAPASVLAGGVHIGSDTLIGMNTSIYMKVKIGERVTVANQSSVIADVKDGVFVRP
jgi:sugar O-acyltransferase (sialic acid O-acetyltransferase NeuD family)